jgi:P-type E1-E2 ATPase
MREGEEKEVNEQDLLVGDLVKIKTGMVIPVDGILISGFGVVIDESGLTGESAEIKKEKLCTVLHED